MKGITKYVVIKSKITGKYQVMSYKTIEEYFEIMDNVSSSLSEIINTDDVSQYLN